MSKLLARFGIGWNKADFVRFARGLNCQTDADNKFPKVRLKTAVADIRQADSTPWNRHVELSGINCCIFWPRQRKD